MRSRPINVELLSLRYKLIDALACVIRNLGRRDRLPENHPLLRVIAVRLATFEMPSSESQSTRFTLQVSQHEFRNMWTKEEEFCWEIAKILRDLCTALFNHRMARVFSLNCPFNRKASMKARGPSRRPHTGKG